MLIMAYPCVIDQILILNVIASTDNKYYSFCKWCSISWHLWWVYSTQPVSYTHLDVYKRQTGMCSRHGRIKNMLLSINFCNNFCTRLSRTLEFWTPIVNKVLMKCKTCKINSILITQYGFSRPMDRAMAGSSRSPKY